MNSNKHIAFTERSFQPLSEKVVTIIEFCAEFQQSVGLKCSISHLCTNHSCPG